MTQTLNAQHGARIAETRAAIRNRETFKTHGSLSGTTGNGTGNTGALNYDEHEAFYADVNAIDYVVYSYSTPIAWHTEAGWHVVQQRFSVTTSKHQTQVRIAIDA